MYTAAIIGLGQIAYKMDEDAFRKQIWTHAKAYQTHSDTGLLAVCDIDKSNYENFQSIYPNIEFYHHFEEMIESKNIDILSICTPTKTHLETVRKIVKLKPPKAIFIEKPMGQNENEALEIEKLCKESNIILAVNYMRRWESKYEKLYQIIKSNRLGKLQSISAYGCTALLTSTSHLIDLFLYYGGDVDWLVSSLQNDYIREVYGINDPGGYAFVKFKNGSYGFLKGTSKNPYNYMFEIDLLFSDGRATVSLDGKKFKIEKFTSKDKSSGSDYKTLERIDSNQFKIINNERMIEGISDIIYCIEKNLLPKSNAKNAIQVHRFIQTMKKSDIQGNKKIIYDD